MSRDANAFARHNSHQPRAAAKTKSRICRYSTLRVTRASGPAHLSATRRTSWDNDSSHVPAHRYIHIHYGRIRASRVRAQLFCRNSAQIEICRSSSSSLPRVLCAAAHSPRCRMRGPRRTAHCVCAYALCAPLRRRPRARPSRITGNVVRRRCRRLLCRLLYRQELPAAHTRAPHTSLLCIVSSCNTRERDKYFLEFCAPALALHLRTGLICATARRAFLIRPFCCEEDADEGGYCHVFVVDRRAFY